MSELKNCPFCGSNHTDVISDYVTDDDCHNEKMMTKIVCKDCGHKT